MKNKIITYYELLKLIKDNKAPYEVIYQGTKYYIDEVENYYRAEDRTPLFEKIFDNYSDYDALQEKVTIPEENAEWEDIGELKLKFGGDCKYRFTSENGTEYEFPQEIADIINQLIKNQKYLKEKLEEK